MKTQSHRTLISSIQTGTRTVNGTDWPILTTLHRVALPGRRPEWVVTWGVCNGTADRSETYRTARAAWAAFGG